nr:MAG TPA: hypothetical protein [Caudoviricetes sp.]
MAQDYHAFQFRFSLLAHLLAVISYGYYSLDVHR